MVDKATLRGITWNHSRGYVSVVATAQRFTEVHPEVEITWEKRSLQAFADAPIGNLADVYDLLVIDHPWAGFAADTGVLVPLQEHIASEFLQDQARNSVGKSHESYQFDGNQYALAIDAATPVAAYRPDLLDRYQVAVPQSWAELLALARQGYVIMPGIPLDTLMNFYMLCSTQGEDPLEGNEWVVSDTLSLQALEQLRELAQACPAEIFNWNPIAVYETLSRRDDFVYCPFAYGYSNYSRAGYSDHVLVFDDMVSIGDSGRCRTTLGGTGLAISAKCQHLEVAVQYAQSTAAPLTQRTLFVENGGQPGHRAAWLDDEVNRRTSNFFQNTLPALDRAYLRPRYPGYLHLQDNAGIPIQDYVINGGNPRQVLAQIKQLYDESKGISA